ncbi:hypothetical protein [Neisseria leonii]|uniref:hypothetical protein n=1 Tax=Neisseria leonii TaxID=2995413 RepID=UPI00237AC70E|nr:hypothetical protein [Neisseria sp. 3986]MDD9326248.1 hypothetical protein [Neisseria sp. 3986]
MAKPTEYGICPVRPSENQAGRCSDGRRPNRTPSCCIAAHHLVRIHQTSSTHSRQPSGFTLYPAEQPISRIGSAVLADSPRCAASHCLR